MDANVHNHVDFDAATGFVRPYPGETHVLRPAELLHGTAGNVAGVVAEAQGGVADAQAAAGDPEDATTADGRSAAADAERAHGAVLRARARAARNLPAAQQRLVTVSRGGYTCEAAHDGSQPGSSHGAAALALGGLGAVGALGWAVRRRWLVSPRVSW